MATPLYITGFEHQAPFTTNGGGLYSLVTGTWSIDTGIKHTGNASAKVAVSSGAAANVRINKGLGTVTEVCGSVYINFGASLPGGTIVLPLFGAVNSPASNFPNVCYNPNTGFFGAQIGTLSRQEDNVTVQANTWYKIEFLAKIIGGTTQTLDVKIDNRTLTQSSAASTTTNYATIMLGTTRTDHAVAFNVYYDDLMFCATQADYPLSAGNDYGVEGLLPSSDGTHVPGTNSMEDQAGNDINGTTVTAYDKINSVPPDATVYIRQAATGSNYAEILFAAISASHASIMAVMATLAYTSATTSANRGACIVSKDNFSTYTEVWGNPTTTADYSDGATNNLFFKTAIISGAIDDTTVNALKARMGYSGDVTPNPYWIDLIAEVAYFASASTDIVLNLIIYTRSNPDVTILENVVLPLDLVTYSRTVLDLTLIENIDVSLDLVSYTRTNPAITVLENVVITLDLVSYSRTIQDVIILENVVVSLDLVPYSRIFNPLVVTDNIAISLDLVTYTRTVNNLTVLEAIVVPLDLVSYSNIVNSAEFLEAGDLYLDLVTYTRTINDLTVLESTLIPLPMVSYSSTVNPLMILEEEILSLNLITYSIVVNDVLLVTPIILVSTPLERIYTIPSEIRLSTIEAEDRTFTIDFENRTVSLTF